MTIGIVLADHHPIVLDGLAHLLALEPDVSVLASCLNGEQTLQAVIECRPEVLLLDLDLPDVDGIEVLRRLRKWDLPTRVVLLAAVITDEQAEKALNLNVDGILLKELPSRLIMCCIRKVYGGGRWLEIGSVWKVLERVTANRTAQDAVKKKVSLRELEIIRLVARGLSNKQIASQLFNCRSAHGWSSIFLVTTDAPVVPNFPTCPNPGWIAHIVDVQFTTATLSLFENDVLVDTVEVIVR